MGEAVPVRASIAFDWLDLRLEAEPAAGLALLRLARPDGFVLAMMSVPIEMLSPSYEVEIGVASGRMRAHIDRAKIAGLRAPRHRMSWAPVLHGCAVYDDVSSPADGRSGPVVMTSCTNPVAPVLFDGDAVFLDGAQDLNLALVHDVATGAKQAIFSPLACDEVAVCLAQAGALNGAEPHLHACVPSVFAADGVGLDYVWTGAVP